MSLPKPPFYSVTEELLYNIYLKLSAPTGALTAPDIDTLAKLNAIIGDADLVSTENLATSINALKGNVPDVGNTLEKLYNIIQALNYLKREDIDTLAEINALLIDADLVKTSDLTSAISALDSKKELQFYFHSEHGNDDDDFKDRDRFVIRGKITSLVEDFTNELSGVTYKSRIDTSSTWIAHGSLAALQSWINTAITGDYLTGTKFWLKCVPIYKPGRNGEAVNSFRYRLN